MTICRAAWLIALIATSSAALAAAQSRPAPRERTVTIPEGMPISAVVRPDDQVVIVKRLLSPPPVRPGPTPTLKAEIDRITRIAHAIVLLEVRSVDATVTPQGDWIRTRVHSSVKEFVRGPDGAVGDGKTIRFELDGGETRIGGAIVRAGPYPILRPNATYLIMFRHDPSGQLWYPFFPFRLDDNMRLVRAEFVAPSPVPFETPIDGQPAKEIIDLFRRAAPQQR